MDTGKDQPLYQKLVLQLKKEIEEDMLPHTSLLSERDLTEKYQVSRTTIRLALNELEKMGYIYRQHGKGTFVSPLNKEVVNLMNGYSFSEHMKDIGKVPKTYLLEYAVFPANDYFASKMMLKEGDLIIKLKRLRTADGLPYMVERTYIPYYKFGSMVPEDIEKNSLYNLFENRYKEVLRMANEEFYASITSATNSKLLEISSGSACLNLVRTTYNIKSEIVEFTLSVARADQFRYKITHMRI